jgi:dihydrofolate reductase
VSHEAEWNASVIKGDLGAEVTKLKKQSGQDLLIYGRGALVDDLTRLGLIDEYRFIVYPVLVGTGKRIFDASTEKTLHLIDATTTNTGVVVLTYAAA